MRLLPTAAGKLNLTKTRALLTRMGQAFDGKAGALAASAAHAERQQAFGMAQDLHRGAAGLRDAGADLLRLSDAARGLRPYEIQAATQAAKERAAGGWALAKLTTAAPGPVPGTAAGQVLAERERWAAAQATLERARTKLAIDPAQAGDSLNASVETLAVGGRHLATLAEALGRGEAAAPAALQQLRTWRASAPVGDALQRARLLAGV